MNDNYEKYIASLNEGSYEAFTDLYRNYANKLYGFALIQTKSTELSEDIVQETFLKIWDKRKQLNCYGSVHALLFTIARNLIIDAFRKQISQINFEDYKQSCNKISSLPTPDEQVAYHELEERLQHTKKRLTKRACQIFEMSREKDMSIQEIADSLNLSSQTVKNNLTLTLKIFKKELKKKS